MTSTDERDPRRAPREGDELAVHYKVSKSRRTETRKVLFVDQKRPDCLTRIFYRDHDGREAKCSRGNWVRGRSKQRCC